MEIIHFYYYLHKILLNDSSLPLYFNNPTISRNPQGLKRFDNEFTLLMSPEPGELEEVVYLKEIQRVDLSIWWNPVYHSLWELLLELGEVLIMMSSCLWRMFCVVCSATHPKQEDKKSLYNRKFCVWIKSWEGPKITKP